MRIHHREHHGTYVKKLNEALSRNSELQKLTLAELLRDTGKLPAEIRAAVKNNGGGHFNHDLFWSSLAPRAVARAARRARDALEQDFGSLEAFRTKFSDAAAKHFASGWVALVTRARDAKTRRSSNSRITRWCAAADATAMFILDVWEHAYYLKYQNRRPEFIEAFWNIVDWAHRPRRRFSIAAAAALGGVGYF